MAAETAIVVDKLISLLNDQINRLKGVKEKISHIKEELEFIKAYLKAADKEVERTGTNTDLKEWVKQVREVAFRMEDVIEKYLLKVENHGGKPVHWGRTVRFRHKIASEIEDIRKSRDRLNQIREQFGLNPSTRGSNNHIGAEIRARHGLRQRARFVDDAELVGVDETKEMLMRELSGEESRRKIISVVGEGGLGKTAIMHALYKKQKEERCFDCYAWITVSRSLKAERLLRTTIQGFCDGDKNAAIEINENMDQEALISELKKYLQTKRYMIVFDDVWEEKFCGDVLHALPDNNKNNRIMITTRKRGVAEHSKAYGAVYIHELKPLCQEDALELFYRKVFQFDDSEGCDEALKRLSQDFVNKCNGVPLAIVALAGLLSTKNKDLSEWSKVQKSLYSKLSNNPILESYNEVLLESYNDLDYHLKSCLLYFGLFPEGYSISCTRLTNLWVVEGFVKKDENDDQTIEEVAEEYLNELICRSLVKVSEMDPYGRVRRCHVHDFMHEFLLKECEDWDFFQAVKNEQFQFGTCTRRLSILTNTIYTTLPKAAKHNRVRSCFGFNLQELPKYPLQSLLSHFKLLVVLDFEDAPLDHLPKAVGTLCHLRYLNLRNTRIATIPEFVSKLLNLEILDLKHTRITELSEYIYQLVKLRYLIVYSSSHGVILKKGIRSLKALQKLARVDASNEDEGVIEELTHAKEMRRLGIINLRRHKGNPLCAAIQQMKHLCSLSIATPSPGNEVLDLHSISHPPQYLQRLYLVGRLEQLPDWIPKLGHLVKLRLACSKLMEDPLLALTDLTELMDLSLLQSSYEGEELHFRSGWFKKLKLLKLQSMQRLRRLRIDSGAMPLLEDLHLGFCPQMEKVPTDIQNLRTLKFLHLEDMSEKFVKNMEEQSLPIFHHISSVTYFKDGHNLRIHP